MVVFKNFLEMQRRISEVPAETSQRSNIVTLQRRNIWSTEVKVKEQLNIATFTPFLHQNYKKHGRPNFLSIERRTKEERNTKQEQPERS